MDSPEETLIVAAYTGKFEAVVALVNRGVNINYQNRKGVSPLLAASEKGDFGITKFLLDNGADCNVRQREWHRALGILEWSPLVIAAMNGHEEIIKLLIVNGADVNFRDGSGRSALSFALHQRRKNCVKILILSGAEVSPVDFATAAVTCPDVDIKELLNEAKKSERVLLTPSIPMLHLAAYKGNQERLRELINTGTDINLVDKSGSTALHIAVENGYLGCAELLIKEGANVNMKDKHKRTPLHIAASRGIGQIIPHLVGKGAIVDAEGEDKITPLHCAVLNSFPLCVKQLLNNGAHVNRTFADDKTALHVAVTKSHECIGLLMEENADIFRTDGEGVSPLELAIELGLKTFKKVFPGKYNVSSTNGTTPLHIAARCSNCECLQLMIDDGCDMNVVTDCGDTPLHYACSRRVSILRNVCHESTDLNCQQNIELLIKAGADINKKNNDGMSPIHVCAQNGLIAPLRELIKYGAKINSSCRVRKQTPLLYAAEAGSLNCIKYLIEKGVSKKVTNSNNCTALMLAAKNNHFSCVKFLLQNDAPLWIL